jgi:hypothetical protein
MQDYVSWPVLDHAITSAVLNKSCTGFRLNSESLENSVMMHAVVGGIAPGCVSDVITPVSALDGRAHLRSATLGLYDLPRTRTLRGTKAFSVAVPKAWNSLPQSICDIQSAATFKRHLKTYLFDIAYR